MSSLDTLATEMINKVMMLLRRVYVARVARARRQSPSTWDRRGRYIRTACSWRSSVDRHKDYSSLESSHRARIHDQRYVIICCRLTAYPPSNVQLYWRPEGQVVLVPLTSSAWRLR